MGGWGALWGSSPTPLERAGTEPSRAGPYFFEEIGERTPRGRRFLPLGTPFSGERNGGRWLGRYGPGLRPPRPTPHGPPTSSGGREKWSVDGRREWETKRLLSPLPRAPTTSPARPAGGRAVTGPFAVRAAGRVSRKKYSLPPHNPTREGSPEGRTSSLWWFFPPFLPKKWGPGWASQSSLPFQRRREKPTRAPRPGRPAVPTAPGPPTPSPRCPYSPKTATDSPAYPAGPPGAGRHRPPPPPGRCPPSSGRTRRGSPPGRRPAGRKRPG